MKFKSKQRPRVPQVCRSYWRQDLTNPHISYMDTGLGPGNGFARTLTVRPWCSLIHYKESLSLYRLRPESRRDIPRLTGTCFTPLRRYGLARRLCSGTEYRSFPSITVVFIIKALLPHLKHWTVPVGSSGPYTSCPLPSQRIIFGRVMVLPPIAGSESQVLRYVQRIRARLSRPLRPRRRRLR
jgi:hypothetical protein